MSLTAEQLADLPDRAEVLDADGRSIGRVRHIFDSDQVGTSVWVTIDDERRPDRPSRFVPLQGARVDGAGLRLAYAERVIDSAPDVADHEVIDSTTERRLRAHYGLDAAGGAGAGPTVIRSEERMVVGTRIEATERVLVHKYIVTEEVTRTITLRREEIRVERQPLGDIPPTSGPTGPAFTDEVEEIVLYAEEPVISTRVVPREIVRLSKHTVTDEETVAADLAREQIDVDRTEGQR